MLGLPRWIRRSVPGSGLKRLVSGFQKSTLNAIEIDDENPSAGTWPRIPTVSGWRWVLQMLIVAHSCFDRSAPLTALRIWEADGVAADAWSARVRGTAPEW